MSEGKEMVSVIKFIYRVLPGRVFIYFPLSLQSRLLMQKTLRTMKKKRKGKGRIELESRKSITDIESFFSSSRHSKRRRHHYKRSMSVEEELQMRRKKGSELNLTSRGSFGKLARGKESS